MQTDDVENIQMESMVGESEHSNHTTEGNNSKQIIKNKKEKFAGNYDNPFRP